MDSRTLKRVRAIKNRVCSDSNVQDGWTRYGYYDRNDLLDKEKAIEKDNITRIDALETSCEEFIEKYEKTNTPVMILNLQKDWNASKKWLLDRLAKKYRNQRFRCGDDDDGNFVRIKMKYYVDYMKNCKDDFPLYIFDEFGDHKKKKRLLEDYHVPKYFRDDLFHYGNPAARPPFRWIVLGPARSSSEMHTDPLGTSAWNALISGHKRWCLFPPDTPPEMVKLAVPSGIMWFDILYPKTQEPTWPVKYKATEVLQRPGETIYVPTGWWHVVLNLDETIAVTQNFASVTNFPIVWHKTVRHRPKFSKDFYRILNNVRPDLAKIADKVKLDEPTGIYSESSCDFGSSSSDDSSCDSNSSESDSDS